MREMPTGDEHPGRGLFAGGLFRYLGPATRQTPDKNFSMPARIFHVEESAVPPECTLSLASIANHKMGLPVAGDTEETGANTIEFWSAWAPSRGGTV